MACKVIVTERADELIEKLFVYLMRKIKNPDAAVHFLDELDKIYTRLEENPYQFHESLDDYLKSRGYREAHFREMQYHLVFRVEENSVYIVGVFHDLENYTGKVKEDVKQN